MDDLCNPFECDSNNVFDIGTKIETILENLYKPEIVEDKQFKEFLEKRVWNWSTPLSDRIRKNEPSLFISDEHLNSAKRNLIVFNVAYNMQNK